MGFSADLETCLRAGLELCLERCLEGCLRSCLDWSCLGLVVFRSDVLCLVFRCSTVWLSGCLGVSVLSAHLLSLQILMIINLHSCHDLSNLLTLVSFLDVTLNACFWYLWTLPSYQTFCCRPLRAASRIALQPMPG